MGWWGTCEAPIPHWTKNKGKMMQQGSPAAAYSVETKEMLGPFLLLYFPGLNIL